MCRLSAATKWLILESYQSGESVQEIAARLSLSEETIKWAIRTRRKPSQPSEARPETLRVTLIEYDPEWQKALTEKIRTTALYKDWRRAVLRGDRYRCRECGNRKGVQADHIYPLSAIIHNYRINSLEEAAECELLWRVDNGRALCPICHRRTDTHGAKAKRLWVRPDEVD